LLCEFADESLQRDPDVVLAARFTKRRVTPDDEMTTTTTRA